MVYTTTIRSKSQRIVAALDVGRLGDVAGDPDDLALGDRLDGGDSLVDAGLVARHDGDVGARGGEFLRHREAKTLAAAGDQRAAPVETNFHGGFLVLVLGDDRECNPGFSRFAPVCRGGFSASMRGR